ncbi:hypothetical protein IQ03_04365 [Gemmobacter caeni]|uniref:hypothetical protein n=1 Tax=Gemmobacter caeni TaxID=589035 RepID=UPI0011A28B68|nr:hypothetical protein [Gemmobacter caeni]TWI93964.1 hypothetical protein IQ03_04365 [Gemmobacter caeni]
MALLSTSEIQALIDVKEPFAQLDMLADKAAAQDVIILSCGPSLSEYSPEVLQDLLAGKCVIAVKQAYDVVPEAVDFQILNTWNSQKYDYSRRRPFIIRETAAGDPPVFGESDLNLLVERPSALSEQLARKQNFADFQFAATLSRPWGPGVLYEVGFYLAQHLGARRIITLGWDVGVKNSAVMPHFYDRPDPHKTAILAEAARLRTAQEKNRYLHDNGVLYNKPRIIPDEVETCAAASGGWHRYLGEAGIDLVVVSTGALVDPAIPRGRLEELLAG